MFAVRSATALSASLLRCLLSPRMAAAIPLSRLYHKNVIDHAENPRNVGAWRTLCSGACTELASSLASHRSLMLRRLDHLGATTRTRLLE